ncbi:MAG: trypsin-like peptidase domain-containing protein, partial [Candidatus Limnocylindria bacterium]
MGPIEDLGKAINGIAESAGKSTVGIGNRWRGGSGVVIEDGKVLTNAHNLHGDEVRVFFADGSEAEGTVLGADGDGDLAVLGVKSNGAPPIEWGDASALA